MSNQKSVQIIVAMVMFVSLLCNISLAGERDSWVVSFTMSAGKNSIALRNPQSIYVDTASERYYITDSGNNRLLSFGKDGEPLYAFDAGGKLEKPVAMIKKGKASLYVLEKGKASITRINLKTREIESIYLTYNDRELVPQRIKQSKLGVIILDKLTGGLYLLNDNFAGATPIQCADCAEPFVDVQFVDDRIYGITEKSGRIIVISADRKNTAIELDPPPEFPVSFAIDSNSNFWVLERHQAQVAVFNQKGKIKYRFLEKGAKVGQLSYPVDMQFDPWGRLCIVDEGNGRVSVYSH